jgi:hypothetical protein
MRPARCLVAATLVAAALCADRTMAAAPSMRPEAVQLAQRLVNRLSVSFRRVAPVARFIADRQAGPAVAAVDRSASLLDVPHIRLPISPFQFRLPPPTAA